MTATRDGAYLAHISDTLTAIAEQLDEQREVQQNVLTALNALLETNRAQSEMLAEILGAATQDAGPSPVAVALEALAAQIRKMDENQTNLIALVAERPEAVGRQFETSGACQGSCRLSLVTILQVISVAAMAAHEVDISGSPTGAERATVLTSGKVRCSPSRSRSLRCAWLRVAPLLPSPPLRSVAWTSSGRDGKAGASIERESWVSLTAAWMTALRSQSQFFL